MTRYQLFLLGWVLLMIIGPAAFTQFPGGGGGFGGKGGKGGMGGMGGGGDRSAQMFNMISGGADSIDVNKVQLPEFLTRMEPAEKQKERMMTFLQKKGVSNGVMTKENFSEYLQDSMRDMGKRMAEDRFTKLSGGRGSFNVDSVQIPEDMQRWEKADDMKAKMKTFLQTKGVNDGTMTAALYAEYSDNRMREFREMGGGKGKDGGRGEPMSDAEIERRAKESFDRYDANQDGKLTKEEVESRSKGPPSRILEEWAKWDTNKDGVIDFQEYLPYMKERMGGNRDQNQGGPDAPPAEDQRPTVYRYGKLPRELPQWFNEYDGDKDAQIGLYEWKKSGRSVKEFLEMDTNADGFITVEELVRVQKAQKKDEVKNGVAYSTNPATGPGGNGNGNGGGGEGRFGKMDWGKGGGGKGDWGKGGGGKGDWGKGGGGKGDWGKGGKGGGGGGEGGMEFFTKKGKGKKGRDGGE